MIPNDLNSLQERWWNQNRAVQWQTYSFIKFSFQLFSEEFPQAFWSKSWYFGASANLSRCNLLFRHLAKFFQFNPHFTGVKQTTCWDTFDTTGTKHIKILLGFYLISQLWEVYKMKKVWYSKVPFILWSYIVGPAAPLVARLTKLPLTKRCLKTLSSMGAVTNHLLETR